MFNWFSYNVKEPEPTVTVVKREYRIMPHDIYNPVNEEFPVYLVHLVTDAIEDGYKEAYDALNPEEQKFIRKAVNVEACKLVKELAYNKTKAA